ncbi:hypothetical protein U8D42_17245 [Mycobacterium europaeum]|uniref:hypothetical protein n=1 Tax=Mycobacterium europaeum TaxID=761804 RepID=UPI002ADF5F0A|nr:hypothetical protein [Mycobacterium europaeum]MEA1159787.1 hypothetical protein [Mycobacterium europaeum]
MTEGQVGFSSFAFFSPSTSMTIKGVAFTALPGTAIPRCLAAFGTTTETDDRPAEPALVVAFDFPEITANPVSKPVQETRDVDAFLRDSVARCRITSPSVVNHNDPPDVLAYVDEQEFGIEAAQLLPPDCGVDRSNSIVGRWKSFEAFRDKVIEEDWGNVRQHRGLLVVMHFGQTGATPTERLPPRRANLGSAIAALRTSQPVIRDPMAAATSHPTLNESEVIQWSSDRSIFFTWTPLPPWYSSPFHDRMGFELAVGYHATVTQTDVRGELRRIVEDHDSVNTKTLVITVNAPLRSGLSFPTNKLVADMLFRDQQPLGGWTPSHIERIALHNQNEKSVKWVLGSSPWV